MVDDNCDFLAVARDYIEATSDFKVSQSARSEAEALDCLEHRQPDVVIVDLALGSTSGLDLTRQIKARWPHLPVVVLSMHDTALHRQAAQESGANGYVVKSAMATDLVPLLGSVIHNPVA
jgi:DNA-binding NarL/FixJ family response regulator